MWNFFENCAHWMKTDCLLETGELVGLPSQAFTDPSKAACMLYVCGSEYQLRQLVHSQDTNLKIIWSVGCHAIKLYSCLFISVTTLYPLWLFRVFIAVNTSIIGGFFCTGELKFKPNMSFISTVKIENFGTYENSKCKNIFFLVF